MKTLLMCLAGPMQSWGSSSQFNTRETDNEPTKSGVIGMIASGLGVPRDDPEPLAELSKLRFGVRVDREGELICDLQTVHEADYWTTRDSSLAHVTHRYYLCDAVFLVGLESEDTELLEICARALSHPYYPLFLGRRSCPPMRPPLLGIRDADLETALFEEPVQVRTSESKFRTVIEPKISDEDSVPIRDVPVSFNPYHREFRYRWKKEYFVDKTTKKEHDAFEEVLNSYQ